MGIYECEINYLKQFCETKEYEDFIEFTDPLIPDMYMHNFILVKNFNKLNEIIYNRLLNEPSFLRIEYDGEIDHEILNNLALNPEITVYDIMSIETNEFKHLKVNTDCEIKAVNEEDLYNIAFKLELQMSPSLGEFVERKYSRKFSVYKDHKVNYYICFYQGTPVGTCELFLDQNTAKIEEFSVSDAYQRKGIGTTILRHLLYICFQSKIKEAYVVTDQSDTAKDMYVKCGFKKVSERTELFYRRGDSGAD